MKRKTNISKVLTVLSIGCICLIFFSCGKKGKAKKVNHLNKNNISLTNIITREVIQKSTNIEKTINSVILLRDISNNINSFSELLNIRKSIQNASLTNITQEGISNIYLTLDDPTYIIVFLKSYINGNFNEQQIAKKFFDYMEKNYPEERLQACAKFMLGKLTLQEVYNSKTLNINEEKFNNAVEYLEKVIQLPTKKYYYFPALDELIYLYRIKGDLNVNIRKKAYSKGREYAWKQFNECTESSIKDDMLCTIMELCDSPEQARELLYKYKNRKWTSTRQYENFINSAKICHSIE